MESGLVTLSQVNTVACSCLLSSCDTIQVTLKEIWIMTSVTNEPAIITRTERGLTIAGTRITLYDVMDYVTADYSPAAIADVLNLTETQVSAALAYLEANRAEVTADYQAVLQEAAEIRQYWEERNREHFAQIATMPPKPGREALWAKLQDQKARHQPLRQSEQV